MDDLDTMARELLAAEYERDRPGSEIAARLRGGLSGQLSTAATVALAAVRTALLTAPPGYALVPIEPTGEMLRAALRAPCSGHPETGGQSCRSIYRAMIAAAPEPEA